jgi:hypothetical protein
MRGGEKKKAATDGEEKSCFSANLFLSLTLCMDHLGSCCFFLQQKGSNWRYVRTHTDLVSIVRPAFFHFDLSGAGLVTGSPDRTGGGA